MESICQNRANPEQEYQNAGIFKGLFPSILTDDSIINKYEEVFRPNEPILPDSLIYNTQILKKPTNTW